MNKRLRRDVALKFLSVTIPICVAALVVLVTSSPALAVRISLAVDVHQGKTFIGLIDPGTGLPFTNNIADDFHLWGVIESAGPAPTLAGTTNFQTVGPPTYAAVPLGLSFPAPTTTFGGAPVRPLPPAYPGPVPPVPPFYYFDANWSTTPIPTCTWMHFAVGFNVINTNLLYWMQAVWTKNGVDPPGQPIYGFYVKDGISTPEEPLIHIQNASGVDTTVESMQMMILTEAEGNAEKESC